MGYLGTKRNAHVAVHRAVKAGQLVKPSTCSRCSAHILQLLAHHRGPRVLLREELVDLRATVDRLLAQMEPEKVETA